jgi:protein-S-isoprenylcysteine O-methyltransferase Ste14
MQSKQHQDSYVKKVISNLFEGELGKRGEVYVLLQLVLVYHVVRPPSLLQMTHFTIPSFELILFWTGLIPLSMGVCLFRQGCVSLGENMTPLVKPIENNQLKTDGAYALCRHPLYCGGLLACLGLSITTMSPARLMITAALFALLVKKAARFAKSTFLCAYLL